MIKEITSWISWWTYYIQTEERFNILCTMRLTMIEGCVVR